jgi:hypothetical protein
MYDERPRRAEGAGALCLRGLAMTVAAPTGSRVSVQFHASLDAPRSSAHPRNFVRTMDDDVCSLLNRARRSINRNSGCQGRAKEIMARKPPR